ncbi:hypothetical protein CPB83DRAFT_856343 [Crepidotus variabilis]|uniref:Uncharacterized protein n=1 Tax=Crepidotus variabilis TaxID=179855 RepID=A0A9P6EDX3_9AGAR|nr:hypothetical protein CPB83DRAFT_856343 [Crepidotus variabilis]
MTVEDVPEMGRFLRQTVDNSLEEGQFESAVSMLDQLRSPNHKPSVIHILHLIFIALHSTSETQLNEEEAKIDERTLLAQSPRKILKHTKDSMILSGAAVVSAQQLLMSLLNTNIPEIFGEALPLYPETKNEPPMIFDFSESLIFKQAESIKHSKNCWEILKSSFYARSTHLLSTPKGKGKRTSRLRFAEPAPLQSLNNDEIKVVGDNSWFILEWLVALFERDADIREKEGQQRHSPLLLKQLPPPPIGSSARWDASEAVKVVFYALQQDDSLRQKSGVRLMNLLIELTQTSFLNLPSVASAVLAQLTTSQSAVVSPSTPASSLVLDQFSTLFAHLSSTPAHLSFKLALCKKILDDATSGEVSSAQLPSKGKSISRELPDAPRPTSIMKKPKPQPRAVPKPRPVVVISTTEDASTSIAGQSSESGTQCVSRTTSLNTLPPDTNTTISLLPPPTFVARLPSYVETITLARFVLPFFTFSYPQNGPRSSRGGSPAYANHLPNKPWATPTLIIRVKFELMLAYALVQGQRQEMMTSRIPRAEPPDGAFTAALKDGSFANVLNEVFKPQGGNENEDIILFGEMIRATVGLSIGNDDGDLIMG